MYSNNGHYRKILIIVGTFSFIFILIVGNLFVQHNKFNISRKASSSGNVNFLTYGKEKEWNLKYLHDIECIPGDSITVNFGDKYTQKISQNLKMPSGLSGKQLSKGIFEVKCPATSKEYSFGNSNFSVRLIPRNDLECINFNLNLEYALSLANPIIMLRTPKQTFWGTSDNKGQVKLCVTSSVVNEKYDSLLIAAYKTLPVIIQGQSIKDLNNTTIDLIYGNFETENTPLIINGADYAVFLDAYNKHLPSSDFDHSGTVWIKDYTLMLKVIGQETKVPLIDKETTPVPVTTSVPNANTPPSFTYSPTPTISNAGNINTSGVAGIYLFFDHGKSSGGLKSARDDIGLISGSHNMFPWRAIEPQEGSYDFSAIDEWLNRLEKEGKRGVFGINLRCEGFKDKTKDDACVPSWALSNKYHPIIVKNPGGTCNVGDQKRLNYLDPGIQKRLQEFVNALGKHYKNDPRVATVLIAAGFNGEPKPQPSSHVYCNRDAERKAYEDAGYTADTWGNYTGSLVDWYHNAFGSNKGLAMILTGTWQSHSENIVRVKRVIKDGVGMHHSGLVPDFSYGDTVGGICSNTLKNDYKYSIPWSAIDQEGEQVLVSFEWNHYFDTRKLLGDGKILEDPAFTWWSVLNALDKHADILTPYTNNINAKATTWTSSGTYQWQWLNLDAWNFAKKYLGKSYKNTPDAWIAFRTSFNRYCGDNDDYEFYLYSVNDYTSPKIGHNKDSGHYAGEISNEAKQYDKRKNLVGWVGPKTDWRGAYSREVSEEYPKIILDLDDRLANRVSNNAQVEVVFFDGRVSDKGKAWILSYKSNAQITTQRFVLNGTNKWRTENITLSNFGHANGLEGGDLILSKDVNSKKGAIYFHFAKIVLR